MIDRSPVGARSVGFMSEMIVPDRNREKPFWIKRWQYVVCGWTDSRFSVFIPGCLWVGVHPWAAVRGVWRLQGSSSISDLSKHQEWVMLGIQYGWRQHCMLFWIFCSTSVQTFSDGTVCDLTFYLFSHDSTLWATNDPRMERQAFQAEGLLSGAGEVYRTGGSSHSVPERFCRTASQFASAWRPSISCSYKSLGGLKGRDDCHTGEIHDATEEEEEDRDVKRSWGPTWEAK